MDPMMGTTAASTDHRPLAEGLLGGPALQIGTDPGPDARVDGPGVWYVLDRALDLGDSRGLLQTLGEMSREEAERALKALAELLRRGVVGYEYREVNGQPQKVFVEVAMGSDLHRAPLVRRGLIDVFV